MDVALLVSVAGSDLCGSDDGSGFVCVKQDVRAGGAWGLDNGAAGWAVVAGMVVCVFLFSALFLL